MKTVGVRELKDRLSEYLREVRSGASVLVTDRGEVIAELSPPGYLGHDASVPPGLLALARRGLISLGSPGGVDLYEALPRKKRGRHTAAQLLDAERGER
jgi:antitoxin (DNA-binding transcriptional repressor) of toxin-antitoxin stability system